jgi:hypothetical protein
LEGKRSEPGGAAKFILRPGTPARQSRGWGGNTQKNLEHVLSRHRKPAAPAPQIAAKIMLPTNSLFFHKIYFKSVTFLILL